MAARIKIGNCAGQHFFKGETPDLQVTNHVERKLADGTVQEGYMHRRKRLVNRAAFNYDPTMGWETDIWFTWHGDPGVIALREED